ncbi:SRPBCC family protein [Jiangella anatolica]|uniref:Activator of HSP90 ATPase n=1 Tax=Jiangella anatolica TaxID=2670374 RepID=A0A2W2BK73_9ACTN|nr:SRPBCC family protein [Jiangella anatolica]PZF86412.1 activator of HSP90 ATPase [Jiangella anatolica]
MTDRIERDIVIAATPQRVWEIVTRAEHLGTWFADAGAQIDLRPGGALTLTWKEYGVSRGIVETVEPHTTFAFRWALDDGAPGEGNSTRVEFTLSPDGDGTRLRVVETGFEDLAGGPEAQAKHVEQNTAGWQAELDELRTYAESTPA